MKSQAISEKLNELFSERGVDLDKLKSLTGIPGRFLRALKDGDLDKLPSPPYVKAYLRKIASVLGVDPEELISAYEGNESPTKESVKRIEPQSNFNKIIFAFFVLTALAGFLGYRFDEIMGRPVVSFYLPAQTTSSELTVSGSLLSGDSLTLNGQTVNPRADNSFSATITLEPGPNTITIDLKRFLGKELIVSKSIYYSQAKQSTPPLSQSGT